jgi:hypothetical protein
MNVMDFEDGQNKYVIEKPEESKVIFGSEIANPPLVVVVQGGKNVFPIIYQFFNSNSFFLNLFFVVRQIYLD